MRFEQKGINLLKEFIQDPKPEKQIAALEALLDSTLANEEKQQLIRDRLHTDSIETLGVLLWGCIHSENFIIPLGQIQKLEEHENEWIAAISMVYLSRAFPEKTIAILKSGLHNKNPRKREFACDEVVDHNIAILKHEVTALENDLDENVREVTRAVLVSSDSPD